MESAAPPTGHWVMSSGHVCGGAEAGSSHMLGGQKQLRCSSGETASDIRTSLGTFSPWVLMTDGSRGPVNVHGLVPPFDEGGQGFLHIQVKQMLFHKRTSKGRKAMVVFGPGFTFGVWKSSLTQGFHSNAKLA